MTYEHFEKLMNANKDYLEKMQKIYDIGIEFKGELEFMLCIEKIFDTAIESEYGKGGAETILWFMYDNDWGKKDWRGDTWGYDQKGKIVKIAGNVDGYGMHDKNGNPICYDLKSLWEYLESNKIKEL